MLLDLSLNRPDPLKFGDVVIVSTDGDDRAYVVAVAPGYGGLKESKAVLVNLSTGDTRGWAPNKDIGPISLNEVSSDDLMNMFSKLDVSSIQIINNGDLKLTSA